MSPKTRTLVFVLALLFLLVVGGLPLGANAGTEDAELPQITFLKIPEKDAADIVIVGKVTLPAGKVYGDYVLTAYVYIGQWYGPKPQEAMPKTTIAANGSFALQYATNTTNNDKTATRIEVMLLKASVPSKDFASYASIKSSTSLLKSYTITRNADEIQVDGAAFALQADYADFDSRFPGFRSRVINGAQYCVNYSPYLGTLKNGGSVKPTPAQVDSNLRQLAEHFDSVRFFMADTSQPYIQQMYDTAYALGLNVIGTAWISGNEAQDRQQIDSLIRLAKAGKVTIASVGSEALYRNDISPVKLKTYVDQVKTALAGYRIPVTYMDTSSFFMGTVPAGKTPAYFNALLELNDACDLILFSHYPIFNSNFTANVGDGDPMDYATRELKSAYGEVSGFHYTKPCILAETGWTTAGMARGKAVPSPENSRKYFDDVYAWARGKGVGVYWFEAYNEDTKGMEGWIDARHWGIFYGDGRVKEAFADLFGSDAAITTLEQLQAALAAAPADGSRYSIEIGADIPLTEAIAISAGQNILLKSTAGGAKALQKATEADRLITVDGSLTLDNIHIDGKNLSGGTYLLYVNGTLQLNRGTIGGSSARGVYVGGTFAMKGGIVSGNADCGVYVDGQGAFNLGGISQITGNGANVVLPDGKTISLMANESTPKNGMKVGVTTDAEDGVFVASGATAAMVKYFSADNGNAVHCENSQLFIIECNDPACPFCKPDFDGLQHGIDYDITDVAVAGVHFAYAGVAKPPAAPEIEGGLINLSKETLSVPSGYLVAAFSVNGGKTWKAGSLTQAAFVKLLDKDLELWLSKTYSTKTKNPIGNGDSTEIIAFAKINKRPAAPRIVVNYVIGANLDGTGDFVLTATGKGADTQNAWKENLQIATADAKGRIGPEGYGKFYDGQANGVPLAEMVNGKITKAVYLVRLAPKEEGGLYTTASKPRKITVSGLQKATAYRIDYGKERLVLKKGDAYAMGRGEFTTVTEAKGAAVDVSACITGGTSIRVKKTATAKKPATEPQAIQPLSRGVLPSSALICAKGKIAESLKAYEFWNLTKGAWGTLPKITGSCEVRVRVKPTAKLSKGAWSGNAASLPGILIVRWGEYARDAKGKPLMGVVSAEIVGAEEAADAEEMAASEERTYSAEIVQKGQAFPETEANYDLQQAQTFTIVNTGTGTLTGLAASLQDASFEISEELPANTLAPGETAVISVRPVMGLEAGPEPYTDTLSIIGDKDISLTVPLSFMVRAVGEEKAPADQGEQTPVVTLRLPDATQASYTSSDETVAKLGEDGRLEWGKSGEARIGMREDSTRFLDLTITERLSLEEWKVQGELALVLEIEGMHATWESSDDEVVRVMQDGAVQLLGIGKVVLTAKDESGLILAEIRVEILESPALAEEPDVTPDPASDGETEITADPASDGEPEITVDPAFDGEPQPEPQTEPDTPAQPTEPSPEPIPSLEPEAADTSGE